MKIDTNSIAHTTVSVHTTQDQRIKFYGIFEGEKQFDDLR